MSSIDATNLFNGITVNIQEEDVTVKVSSGLRGPVGFEYIGTYGAGVTYYYTNVVTYSNALYIGTDAIDADTGITGTDPTNNTYWTQILDSTGPFSAICSQAEAQAGTNNTKGMTPLRSEEHVVFHLADSPDIDAPDIDGGTVDGADLGASSDVDIQGATVTLGSDAEGDVYYRDGSGNLTRLGIGTAGQYIKANAGTTAPEWGDVTQAYGSLTLNQEPTHVDASTITQGSQGATSFTDTLTTNGVYWDITEDGANGIDIEAEFSVTATPGRLKIVGRYEGADAHNVVVQAYDYDNTTWRSFTSAADDIPNNTEDDVYTFEYHDLLAIHGGASSDYLSGGKCKIRFYHATPATGTHHLYLDHIHVLEQTLVIATGGTYQGVSPLAEGINDGMTVSGANGTITADTTGVYHVSLTSSFTGTPEDIFFAALFVDDVIVGEGLELMREIESVGGIASASFAGLVSLTAGEVVNVQISSELTGSYAFVYRSNLSIHKVA